MNEFYMSLEEGIRDIVKLLRDNGFNTRYSCAEAMVVECECYQPDEIESLSKLLSENGYRHFKVEMRYYKKPGESLLKELVLKLPKKDGFMCEN